MSIQNPIIQVSKKPTLKPTYGFVSTQELINSFQSKGWYPVDEKVMRVRKEENEGFQKHLIRLENNSFPSIPGLSESNQSRPQIVIVNSHDGTSALRMMLGLIRMACLNGIIAGTGLREFRVTHSGNLTNKIGEGLEYLVANLDAMVAQIQTLQNTKFTEANFKEFLKNVVDARFQHTPNVLDIDYNSASRVLRAEDQASDAFTAMNRVQESIIRGGIKYTKKVEILDVNGNVIREDIKATVSKKLNSIPQNIKLNKVIYSKAVQLAA